MDLVSSEAEEDAEVVNSLLDRVGKLTNKLASVAARSIRPPELQNVTLHEHREDKLSNDRPNCFPINLRVSFCFFCFLPV